MCSRGITKQNKLSLSARNVLDVVVIFGVEGQSVSNIGRVKSVTYKLVFCHYLA